MDRIKLYEAATGTEAMNEIKAACSNMRNCIRKYASGKANTSAKNEMLEGMRKIEADLKAVVKSGAKTSKKVNESTAINEYARAQGKPSSDEEFKERSDDAYNRWINGGCKLAIYKLIAQDVIMSPQDAVNDGMTADKAFDEFWDEVEGEFSNSLDKAVGGDWYTVGNEMGFSNGELEHIYVDEYQAKTDPFIDNYTQIMINLGAPEY